MFLTRFAEEASRRLPRISGAAWRITEDLQTLRGTPCYFGKRVHIANVLAATQQGMALDDLQAAWPYLTAQPLDDAEVYIKRLFRAQNGRDGSKK